MRTSKNSQAPLLHAQGSKAGYGKAEVLHGIDLPAAAGGMIAVIGPNGAGKYAAAHALDARRTEPGSGA